MGGGFIDREGGQIAGTMIDKLVQLSKRLPPGPSAQLQRAIAAAITSKYAAKEKDNGH